MRSYTLYKISESKFKKKKPPVMCLPSKKLCRGASCLFCLKKWLQCQNTLPCFAGLAIWGLLAAFGQSVTHEKTAKNLRLAS